MKNDIDNTLIRYGKLHLTKQKAFGNDTFHSPPAPIGFYAMPIRFQELFLVSSLDEFQPEYLKKPKNFENLSDEEYEKYERERRKKLIHKFTVKNTDNIWHHLDCKNNVIIDRHGSWVKTSVSDWKKALKKESLKLRAESMGEFAKYSGKIPLQEVRPKSGFYSKDNFEVFIDSKVY